MYERDINITYNSCVGKSLHANINAIRKKAFCVYVQIKVLYRMTIVIEKHYESEAHRYGHCFDDAEKADGDFVEGGVMREGKGFRLHPLRR